MFPSRMFPPPRLLAAALLVLAGLAEPAVAQTAYVRNANGNWSTASQWTPNGVPGPGDYASLGNSQVTLDTDTEVAGLALASSAAQLRGAGVLTVTEAMSWQGGYLQGSGEVVVAPGATLAIAGSAQRGLREQRVLRNQGMATWTSTTRMSNGNESEFINEGTATISAGLATPDALFFAGTFTNTGLLVVDAAGSFDFVSFFHNQGTVQVEAGALLLRGFNANGGTDSGGYVVDAGAVLAFGGGYRTQLGSVMVVGEGHVEVRAGTVAAAGYWDVASLAVTGGTVHLNHPDGNRVDTLQLAGGLLAGSGALVVREHLDWSGGDMGGSGSTTVVAAASAEISGTSASLIGSRSLVLEGHTGFDAQMSNSGTASLLNVGTFETGGDGELRFFGGDFRNEGRIVHDGGALVFISRFDNAGLVEIRTGTVDLRGFNATGGADTGGYLVHAGAVLEFSGGNRSLGPTTLITGGGSVLHTGGTLQHRATVSPGGSPGGASGTLSWTATSYAPLAESILVIDIAGQAPGTGHDLLAIEGTAVLGGGIDVGFLGAFVPGPADTFVVLTATDGVVGEFADVALPPGYVLQIEPDAVLVRPEVLELELFSDGFEAPPVP